MKILLPVDGSDYTKRMVSYIAAHDELLGTSNEYTFLHAVPLVPSYAGRFLDRAVLDGYYAEEAERVLKPLRAFAEQQHWKYHVVIAYGPAAEEVARIAETDKVDLIVMGTHGHTALGNVILGSVATGVLARCKQPVLLIR